MTVSKIPNCPAVRVPIMTQRGRRPTVQRLTKPVSAAMFPRRLIKLPSPPAPALLILERRVSAGWEMMAAATPATTPEARETRGWLPLPSSAGVLPMAIVNRIGGGALHGELGHGVGDLLAEDGTEAGVEAADEPSVLRHLGEAVHRGRRRTRVGDGADTDRLEGAEEEIGDELGAGGGSEVDGGLVLPRLSSPMYWTALILKNSTPPNLNQPWTKYPAAVAPRPVARAPAPSSAMMVRKPPIRPVLY